MRRPWVISILLAGMPAVSMAQPSSLTLADCVRRARDYAPTASAGRFSEFQALRARDEATLDLLPNVAALGGVTGTNNVAYAPILDNSDNAAVDVRFAGFPFSRAWAMKDQKRAEFSATRFSRQESEEDSEWTAKNLYFGILEQSDALAAIDRVTRTLQSLLEAILPRYTVGRAPPFDAVKVRSSLADLARNRGMTAAALAGQKNRLARMIGMMGADPLELTPLTAVPELSAQPGTWVWNPAIKSLEQDVRASEFSLKAARMARYPDLVGDFQYGYAGPGPSLNSVGVGYVGSLGLRLNLFDWGVIAAQIGQQKAGVGLASARLETAMQDVEAQWVQTTAEAEAHRADLDRLRGLMPEVVEASRSSVERYKRGATGILEATDAIDLWLQTQLNERAAYYDYLTSLAQLERLSGDRWTVEYER